MVAAIVGFLGNEAVAVLRIRVGRQIGSATLVADGQQARIERTAALVPGVEGVHDVRVRWLRHRLQAELHTTVDEELPTRESHRIVEEVRHALVHAQPRLAVVTVHADLCAHGGTDPHALTARHDQGVTARRGRQR